MNALQEAETVARLAEADMFGSVHVSYDDARRFVYDIGPAGMAITGPRLQIWSAYDAKTLVDCELSEVLQITCQERSLTASFAGKRLRLTFRGEDSALTEEDTDAIQSSVLALFGIGDFEIPNPVNLVREVGATWRNWKDAAYITEFWFALLMETLTVERLGSFFGDEYSYRAPVMAAAYAESWEVMGRLAAEELVLREGGSDFTRVELLELAKELEIPGRTRMSKATLLTALVDNRRATRDFYMTALDGPEVVTSYNEGMFGDLS